MEIDTKLNFEQNSVEDKIILVRHLATANNRSGVIMGRSIDPDIIQDQQVAIFEDKLRTLAKELRLTTDASIISSPMKRCLSTAIIIQNITQSSQPITIWDELTETDMGLFEGKNSSQLRELYPNQLDQWMFDPQNLQFIEGESYGQVSNRVDQIINNLLGKKLSKIVFICTHVDLIKMFILKMQSRPFNERRSI